jgi:hypothetical protein
MLKRGKSGLKHHKKHLRKLIIPAAVILIIAALFFANSVFNNVLKAEEGYNGKTGILYSLGKFFSLKNLYRSLVRHK